jgi:hypothetical protein
MQKDTMMATKQHWFDEVGFIIQAETDGFEDEQELIDGVQALIDTGTINGLQGSWQRLAANLIRAGKCHA